MGSMVGVGEQKRRHELAVVARIAAPVVRCGGERGYRPEAWWWWWWWCRCRLAKFGDWRRVEVRRSSRGRHVGGRKVRRDARVFGDRPGRGDTAISG